MATILKANNKLLIEDAESAFLDDHYQSGVTSLGVGNADGFSSNDFVLIGPIGSSSSEVKQVSSASTSSITLNSSTDFSHAQDTVVSKIEYDKVEFYQTSDKTFDSSQDIALVDVEADDFFTRYRDTNNSSGYGWFRFKNSHNGNFSSESNPIPYSDFAPNSVKEMLDDFFSSLNQEAKSQISNDDALRWLNEAYSKAVNHLNLVNEEYGVQPEYTISITSGTQEYDLPSDFGFLESVHTKDGDEIEHLAIENILDNRFYTFSQPRYYLRRDKIGFVPTPDSGSENRKIYYKAKSTRLTSFSDTIALPNNQFYILKDFMLYRAYEKLNRPATKQRKKQKDWKRNIQNLKKISIKQNEDKSQMGIAYHARV